MMEKIRRLDNRILEYIQKRIRCPFLDKVRPKITLLGNGGLIWLVVTAVFLARKTERPYGFMLMVALVLCLAVGNIALKPLIGRIRPCNNNTDVELLISRPHDYSAPSCHTLSSFAAATVICFANVPLGIAALVLAALIGFSRLYLFVHYPSDVASGFLLGIALGFFAVFVFYEFLAFLGSWFSVRRI